jgi:hypothetical protein
VLCRYASGKIIYVDGNAAGGNDGMSWVNAYLCLQDALADASNSAKPVEIRVAQGTYKPDHGNGYTHGDKQASFLLESGVTLKGGFAGVGTDDPDAWDPSIYTTVLSGDLSGNDNRLLSNFTENSDHVIWCIDANANTVLEGFTITGGYATDSRGGGMYNTDASPVVRHCVFFDNYGSSGGGMANLGGSPVVTECTFEGNLAKMGGGMFNYESQPLVKFCVFYDNATTTLGGGGMHNYVDCNSTVTNCLFIENHAPFGAGMYNYYADVAITNCTFNGNRANGWGGGIHSEVVGQTIVTNCIVWDNAPDQIKAMGGGWGRDFAVDVRYSAVQGGYTGEGNLDLDPLFADPGAGDYHLLSEAGRWDPSSASWVIDTATSLCIDAGDPNTPVGSEPSPNGALVNMGFYGGMAEASKSLLSADARYSGGTGKPDDPFQIATVADLILLGETPTDNDRHFVLTADLDLDPGLPGGKVFNRALVGDHDWETGEGSFTGVFDGNNHTISNLTIEGGNSLGLFGRLGTGAEVRDLGLADVNITGTGGNVGALAGSNYRGQVTKCYSTGTVTGDRSVGGLVGENFTSSGPGITGCYSTCAVTGTSDFLCNVGGLVGHNIFGRITDSYGAGTVAGREYVGGLVGRNFDFSRITNSYSNATVSGTGGYIGGLVGDNWKAEIANSYSTGPVSGRSLTGGLVGANRYSASITMSYSIGAVTGTGGDIGGLVGQNGGSCIVTACFWDTQASGQTASAGGTGKTTIKMMTVDTYLDAGWDFVGETENGVEDIWEIPAGAGCPVLAWQAIVNPAVPPGDGGGPAGSLPEDFETGDFTAVPWQHSGEAFWVISSDERYSGAFSARAGTIVGGQSTSLEITLSCAAGQIAFWHKVSCHSTLSSLGFYIDGELVDSWSGRKEWEAAFFPVSGGTHTFTWTYSKVGWSSMGEDAAWIDDITFPTP